MEIKEPEKQELLGGILLEKKRRLGVMEEEGKGQAVFFPGDTGTLSTGNIDF